MAVNLTSGVSVGWEGRVSIDIVTAGTAAGAPKIICVDKVLPQHTRELVRNSEGAICGDPDLPNWRTQKGRKFIRGSILMSITGEAFDYLAPLLCWTDAAAAHPDESFELGLLDTLPAWDMDIDFAGSVHQLSNCVCEKWAIRGSKGSMPVQLQIDYIAEDETEGAFAGTTQAITDIFAYTDLTTFNYNSVSRLSADRFLIQVDNKPVIEYGSSLTMTDAHLGPRECVIATSTPYTSTQDDMYWTNRDDETGKLTTIVLASAQRTYTFTAATAIGIPQVGAINSRADQIRTPVTLIAHRSDNAGTRVSPLTLLMADT
jgi:hypothetical protein